ncbi:PREDICTED: uncharacterized protein LOC109287526 [Gavialis gangeticus]|uniref:uncharacterized protein LOC109287526 n=1 Tax=Gavialis gangeticus TaxID=94835 RepID=UPI00092FB19A|nr:PREDICTED: uncharacterized protein LOC109287526 [Gavialis gangeticus]
MVGSCSRHVPRLDITVVATAKPAHRQRVAQRAMRHAQGRPFCPLLWGARLCPPHPRSQPAKRCPLHEDSEGERDCKHRLLGTRGQRPRDSHVFFLVEVSLPPFDAGHEGTQRGRTCRRPRRASGRRGTQPGFLFPAHQTLPCSRVHRPRRNPGFPSSAVRGCASGPRFAAVLYASCSSPRIAHQTAVSAAPVRTRQRGHETRARLAELKPKRGLTPGPKAPQDEGQGRWRRKVLEPGGCREPLSPRLAWGGRAEPWARLPAASTRPRLLPPARQSWGAVPPLRETAAPETGSCSKSSLPRDISAKNSNADIFPLTFLSPGPN